MAIQRIAKCGPCQLNMQLSINLKENTVDINNNQLDNESVILGKWGNENGQWMRSNNNGQSKWMRKSRTMKLELNNRRSMATKFQTLLLLLLCYSLLIYRGLQQQLMLLLNCCDRDGLKLSYCYHWYPAVNAASVITALVSWTLKVSYFYNCSSCILNLNSATDITGILNLRPAHFVIQSNFDCFS